MKSFFLLLIATLTLTQTLLALQKVTVNADIGSSSWSVDRHGVHFSLTQLMPDQLRAFYVNRGFTLQQIEGFASSCVFMSVLRNDDAPGSIHFVSHQWKVVHNQQRHPLRNTDHWIDSFSKQGIKKPALIAFRWAQFPAEQEYQPGGDWNQGMLSIGLPAGSQFDITALWDINGQPYQSTLSGVECAQ